MGLTTVLIFISVLHQTLSDQDGAKAAADFLLEGMDQTAKPCVDFYQYTCGNWEKNTGGEFVGVPQKSTKMIIDRLIKAIKSIPDNDQRTPDYQKQLKIFFTQCVNTSKDYDTILLNVYKATKNAITAPMPMLYPKKKVEKVNSYFLIGRMHHFLNTKVFFDSNVRLMPDGCSNVPMLSLSPAYGDNKPLLLLDEEFPKRLVDLAEQLGTKLNERDVAARISQMEALEREALSILDSVADNTATEPRKDLPKQINSRINWVMYFSGLLAADQQYPWEKLDPKVHFDKVDYFKKVDQFIKNIKTEDLLDYAYLRMFNTSMNHYMITPKLLQTDAENLDDDQRCLEYVLTHAGAAAATLLFEGVESMRGTPKHWKHDVTLLSEAVFAAFRYMIHTAEWVPNDDKASIISKLNAIPFFSGIPNWISDNDSVARNTPPSRPDQTVFDNVIDMYRMKFEWSFEPTYKDAEELEHVSLGSTLHPEKTSIKQQEPSFEWGATFDPGPKKIDLTFGLTLPPMYDISYPLAVKFGLLGWIIGHEMLHAFDNMNVGLTIQGRIGELTEATLKEFRKRVNCINKQYSGYCFTGEECYEYCVSGKSTLDDNIADMDGLKMAYMAYKFTKQMGGNLDEKLPGLEHITPDQLFFLSAARMWCGKQSKEAQIYKSSRDYIHAPGRARIELSMMNFPAFAQAFNCPAGSKFAPLQTCDLWGSFLEPNIQAPNGTDKQGQTGKNKNC